MDKSEGLLSLWSGVQFSHLTPNEMKENMMINSRHSLRWCGHCDGYMVICADCCNNCCNGGTKTLPDGKECGCAQAYEHQTIYWDSPDEITFKSVEVKPD